MITRLKIGLNQEEFSGLLKLSLSEMRNPEEQLRYLLCRSLRQRGMLPTRNEIVDDYHPFSQSDSENQKKDAK